MVGDSGQAGMQKTASLFSEVEQNAKDDRASGCYVLGTVRTMKQWPGYVRNRTEVEQKVRNAINLCAAGKEPWPLTMLGITGSGKTCAALCMCDHYGGKIVTMADFAAELSDVRRGIAMEESHAGVWKVKEPLFWKKWVELNLGVLDDVGGRKQVSDLQYEVLKIAIDKRHGLPMVLTTNEIADIKVAYDDRIWSRLAGGSFVELTFTDRRLQR